ncbi:MAG TPA: AAA family ATPase [Solirubrobacteraceae bacterium]|jgi:DNA-binding CsgD family transcriptional regulator|nr:AAA family ATPase [Solirubrobacteraceae bacterium]
MLIGRDPEQRLIESMVEDARNGASAALVIRGEAGIGKTAVLEDAVASCGFRTLRCAGVESEHDLTFAGLEQLLRPLHDLVDRLPDPQASALNSALGVSDDRVDDRLLLGLATLNLLAEATTEGPLLCAVDDLHWIDRPSAQALLFAARRLGAEGVVMLFTLRDDPASWFEAPGLAQLTLAPLSEADARRVVADGRGATLTPAARRRLLDQARGNPLALLELPGRDGGDAQSTAIEAAFRARVIGLPPDTRRLLLLAAVSETGETGTWAELAWLGDVSPVAACAGVDAGLIGGVDAVVFRHPLVRSAVYNASSSGERAEAHRRLASAATDELARVTHLAAAAREPSEPLAAELETAASAATRRGAFASAATVLVRAAELSTDPGGRVRRLISSAQAYLDAGDSGMASQLAQQALAGATAGSDRAALAVVTGALELQRGTPAAAYDLLLAGAHAVAAEDPARALELQAHAITPAFVAGWPERAFREAHEFVRGLPPSGRPFESFLRLFLGVMVTAELESRDGARERLVEAVNSGAAADDFRLMTWAGIASAYLGDLRSARELYLRAAALVRAAGSFNTLPLALLGPARLDVNARAFDEAEEWATEGIELARQLGQENLETCFSAILVRCLAAHGQIDECRELGQTTLNRALAHGLAVAGDDVRLGIAELELSLAHGAAARDLIEAVSHPLLRLRAAPMLVEASLLSGNREAGRAALDALQALSEQGGDPRLLGVLARTSALLAPSPELAERMFVEALSHLRQHAPPFERARTELAYGEFLRRAQRRTEARAQLRAALATFEGLSTPLWADRARAELEATGITARKRDPSTLDTLTPQELRIARLVAGGASNRGVAGQLFLSPKTVEYHLRKVFLKLGVSSRVELARQPLPAVADRPAD